jgi:hypothetical protein
MSLLRTLPVSYKDVSYYYATCFLKIYLNFVNKYLVVYGRNIPSDQLYIANKDTFNKVSCIVAIYTLQIRQSIRVINADQSINR